MREARPRAAIDDPYRDMHTHKKKKRNERKKRTTYSITFHDIILICIRHQTMYVQLACDYS